MTESPVRVQAPILCDDRGCGVDLPLGLEHGVNIASHSTRVVRERDSRPTDDVEITLQALTEQPLADITQRVEDLFAVHLHPPQKGGGDEDPTPAKGGGRFYDGQGTKPGLLRDEPEVVEEAVGFDGPVRPL